MVSEIWVVCGSSVVFGAEVSAIWVDGSPWVVSDTYVVCDLGVASEPKVVSDIWVVGGSSVVYGPEVFSVI